MIAWLYGALLPDCLTWVGSSDTPANHCIFWVWTQSWVALPW